MWSIIMEPGKTYSTVVENTFHLSMATLDVASVKKADDIHTVYVETNDGQRVILCHLSKSKNMLQCSLDHVITRGTDIKFVTSATANIHMTGYLDDMEELEDGVEGYSDLESEAEEEEEEEELQVSKKQTAEKGNKRKAENSFSTKPKSIKLDENKSANSDEDESDETLDFEDDDSDEEGLTVSDIFDGGSDSDDEVEDDDDDDDDDDEEDEEEIDDDVKPQSNKKAKQQFNGKEQKTPKKEQKTPSKGQEKTPKVTEKTLKGQKTPIPKTPDVNNKSLSNGTAESNKKKNKEPKTPLEGLKNKPDTPLPKDKLNQQQKLNGGVIISDIKVGDGAVAKPGKNVKVYYVGRLKSTGKVFDSMQKGPGFTFGLQRGEVIKGWDIGIAGMKVGGKRKVICPPNMAYGAKGSPPEIPPNSTLVFDVELKHIN